MFYYTELCTSYQTEERNETRRLGRLSVGNTRSSRRTQPHSTLGKWLPDAVFRLEPPALNFGRGV